MFLHSIFVNLISSELITYTHLFIMSTPTNPNVQRVLARSIRNGSVSLHKFNAQRQQSFASATAKQPLLQQQAPAGRQQSNEATNAAETPKSYSGFIIRPRVPDHGQFGGSGMRYSNASNALQAFRAANGEDINRGNGASSQVNESQLIDVIGQSYALKADVKWYRTQSKAQRAFRTFNKKLSECCPDPYCKRNRACTHCQLHIRDAAKAYCKMHRFYFAVLGVMYSSLPRQTLPPVPGAVQWLYGNGDGTATIVTSPVAPVAPAGEAVIPFLFGAGFDISNRPGDLVMFSNISDADSVVVSSRGHLLDTLFIISGNPAPYTWTLTALSIAAFSVNDSIQFAKYVDLPIVQASVPPTPVNPLTLRSKIVTLNNVDCPDQTIDWTATMWLYATFSIVAHLSHLAPPRSEKCSRCKELGDKPNDHCHVCARTVVHMSHHLNLLADRVLRNAVVKASPAFETRVASIASALALQHSNNTAAKTTRNKSSSRGSGSTSKSMIVASYGNNDDTTTASLSPLLSMPLAYLSMLVKHNESAMQTVREARISLIDDASAHVADGFERHWDKWMTNDRTGFRFDVHRRQIVPGKNSDVLRMNKAQLKYVARTQARDAVAHWLRTQAFASNVDDNFADY